MTNERLTWTRPSGTTAGPKPYTAKTGPKMRDRYIVQPEGYEYRLVVPGSVSRSEETYPTVIDAQRAADAHWEKRQAAEAAKAPRCAACFQDDPTAQCWGDAGHNGEDHWTGNAYWTDDDTQEYRAEQIRLAETTTVMPMAPCGPGCHNTEEKTMDDEYADYDNAEIQAQEAAIREEQAGELEAELDREYDIQTKAELALTAYDALVALGTPTVEAAVTVVKYTSDEVDLKVLELAQTWSWSAAAERAMAAEMGGVPEVEAPPVVDPFVTPPEGIGDLAGVRAWLAGTDDEWAEEAQTVLSQLVDKVAQLAIELHETKERAEEHRKAWKCPTWLPGQDPKRG